MPDYIFFMHNDSDAVSPDSWQPYLNVLQSQNRLRGGSEIGPGDSFRRLGKPVAVSESIVGFIRIEARDLAEARTLLDGNPVFEAGGTVEIRELPTSE